MNTLIDFLNRLEETHVWYSIKKSMPDSIAVLVRVPWEIWEISFVFDNGEECSDIRVEKFKNDGTSYEKDELDVLFRDFSD